MKYNILFLSLVVVAEIYNVNASISPSIMSITQNFEEALQKEIAKGNSNCLHYNDIIQNLLDTYNENVKKCEDAETEKLLELTIGEQQSRETTTETLNEVSANLDQCKGKYVNLDFFECVNIFGERSTRTLWKTSGNSSEIAENMREQAHVIKFQKTKCTEKAYQEYYVNVNKAYDDMVDCYINEIN